MKREILFRGKRTDKGEWVEGSLVQMLVDGRIASCIAPIEEVGRANKDVPRMGILYTLYKDIFIVHPDTLGQYTGITDKNDKKIFEGDIVAFTFHSDLAEHARLEERPEITENHVILFHDGSFWMKRIVVPDSLTVHLFGGRIMLESLWKHRIEVIGNIHDNPEMLKGGER